MNYFSRAISTQKLQNSIKSVTFIIIPFKISVQLVFFIGLPNYSIYSPKPTSNYFVMHNYSEFMQMCYNFAFMFNMQLQCRDDIFLFLSPCSNNSSSYMVNPCKTYLICTKNKRKAIANE